MRLFDSAIGNLISTKPKRFAGTFSRVGVFPYVINGKLYWQYRPADEVLDPESIESFYDSSITISHPEDNDEDPIYSHGAVIEASANEDNLSIDGVALVLTDEALKLAKAGSPLSPMYDVILREQTGVYAGQKYDLIQTQIRYSTLGLVDEGRQGDSVKLFYQISKDRLSETQDKDLTSLPVLEIPQFSKEIVDTMGRPIHVGNRSGGSSKGKGFKTTVNLLDTQTLDVTSKVSDSVVAEPGIVAETEVDSITVDSTELTVDQLKEKVQQLESALTVETPVVETPAKEDDTETDTIATLRAEIDSLVAKMATFSSDEVIPTDDRKEPTTEAITETQEGEADTTETKVEETPISTEGTLTDTVGNVDADSIDDAAIDAAASPVAVSEELAQPEPLVEPDTSTPPEPIAVINSDGGINVNRDYLDDVIAVAQHAAAAMLMSFEDALHIALSSSYTIKRLILTKAGIVIGEYDDIDVAYKVFRQLNPPTAAIAVTKTADQIAAPAESKAPAPLVPAAKVADSLPTAPPPLSVTHLGDSLNLNTHPKHSSISGIEGIIPPAPLGDSRVLTFDDLE
jgi:hypothetical protein